MNTVTFDIFAVVILLVLAVITPLIGIWDFKRLIRHAEQKQADARTKFYIWTLVMEWCLTLGFAGYWLANGHGLASLGLVPAASGWQWLAIGLGLIAAGVFVWNMMVTIRSSEKLDKARDEIGNLVEMAPQTVSELRLFNAVAVTAGICEEIIYRGVLLAAFTPLIGTWPAVALSTVVFGIGHAYQGVAGIGKTGLIGLIFALLAVFSGSLFVGIFLHAVMDLTSGLIMATVKRGKLPTISEVKLETA